MLTFEDLLKLHMIVFLIPQQRKLIRNSEVLFLQHNLLDIMRYILVPCNSVFLVTDYKIVSFFEFITANYSRYLGHTNVNLKGRKACDCKLVREAHFIVTTTKS